MVDGYITNDIPFSDVKAASALYFGSAIKYELKNNCVIDDGWICQYVVPEIYEKLGDKRAAHILGKTILWTCLDPDGQDIATLLILKRVTLEYERVQVLDSSTVNPA